MSKRSVDVDSDDFAYNCVDDQGPCRDRRAPSPRSEETTPCRVTNASDHTVAQRLGGSEEACGNGNLSRRSIPTGKSREATRAEPAGIDAANARNIIQFVAKIKKQPSSVMFRVYVPGESPDVRKRHDQESYD
jgi:hypothetical protein